MTKAALTLLLMALLGASPAMAQGRGLGLPPVGLGAGPPGLGLPGGVGAGPPPGLGGLGAALPPVGRAGPVGPGLGVGPPLNVPAAAGRVGALLNEPPGQAVRDVAQGLRDAVGRPVSAVLPPTLDRDERGAPIVRGEILAVSPSAESLAIAQGLRFRIARQDRMEALGLSTAVLVAPDGMSDADALATLRRTDPGGTYDYAHIYNPTGEATRAPFMPADAAASHDGAPRLGMIDGGVETHHPALKDAAITSKCFVEACTASATAHGTAIASLLVGHDGGFAGYLPDNALAAADVFGGRPDGGSAEDIARALNWMAVHHVAVTNISLAGPANALLGAAVKAFVASGHVLVAAVGNNGPAAPAGYPAAYPGVIAVTSVDRAGHLELDASSGGTFAALGVDVRAAQLQGYGSVTGTSYAAPVVAARFAQLLSAPDAAASPAVLTRLQQESSPLENVSLHYLAPPSRALSAQAR